MSLELFCTSVPSGRHSAHTSYNLLRWQRWWASGCLTLPESRKSVEDRHRDFCVCLCLCLCVWQRVRIGVKKLWQADRALNHILFLQVNKMGNVLMERRATLMLGAVVCDVCLCLVWSLSNHAFFIFLSVVCHFSQKLQHAKFVWGRGMNKSNQEVSL